MPAPKLRNLEGSYGVYISPSNWAYAAMFLNRDNNTYQLVQDPRDAHILVWTGGADVDPQLYGQKKVSQTHIQPSRDQLDLALWEIAAEDQLKVGICRGAQFLNVMCGGSMWQDVGKHSGEMHQIWCNFTEDMHEVTSTHHQMMVPNEDREDMWLIAEAHCSSYKMDDANKFTFKHTDGGRTLNPDYPISDAEVIWYEDDLSLCFQPHPEIGHKGTEDYFFTLLESILKGEAPTVVTVEVQPEDGE